ncbi:hypothetical protein A1O7_02921 [Cladophialophora yegresii CBS 114405]|uniref:DUF4329 domain-containing protein n=1 Tax=Cladophialophora yegresii CBS 114405 TaxID=1182544 RepID=W9WW18_9EURO|nr:uncharacterized protein A1O7_02921 [Cladophialophora yegresii CBS 114405]EXJ62484.1 hypothetical protein A1O7_02921 [Cladophialophora yegresii CBS 114405]
MAGVRTVATITLHDLFNSDRFDFKEFRRLMEVAVDWSFRDNLEYRGVIYATADGSKFKIAGPNTDKRESSVTMEEYKKMPDGYTNIVSVYHVHPGPGVVGNCKPSGLDEKDGKGDLSNARSTWPECFYLVVTGRKEPKAGWNFRDRCEIYFQGTTPNKNDYRVWYVYPNWK